MLAGMMVHYEAERHEREVEAMVHDRQLAQAVKAARSGAPGTRAPGLRVRFAGLVSGNADRSLSLVAPGTDHARR